jgi:hypothetical protein
MGDSRFFHVESKSYEIVRHVNDLRIIERGQKHLSHVTMGFATARWCHDILLEFANLPPDQNAFRSFREGNKVFVIQKQRNGKGRFASVTVLGETKDKGSVIIPEGRGAGGWRGFSQEINGVLTPAVSALNHHRRQAPLLDGSGIQRSSHSNGDERSFKEVVILGNQIPKISHANAASAVESRKCSIADSMEMFLKVILQCGPDNKWVVQWAGVMDKPGGDPVIIQTQDPVDPKPAKIGPSLTTNLAAKPNKLSLVTKPTSVVKPAFNHFQKPDPKPKPPKPTPKFIWRPRSGSQLTGLGETSGTRAPPHVSGHSEAPEHVSVHTEGSESQFSESQTSDDQLSDSDLSLAPVSQLPTITEVFQEIGAVAKTWGSSSDWFIDLRDGRRLRLPMDLKNPVADPDAEITKKIIQWVSAHRDNFDVGCAEEGSSWGSQELEDGSEVSGMESESAILDIGKGESSYLAVVNSGESSEHLMIESQVVDVEDPGAIVVIDGGEVVGSEELVPLMVEPLAVAGPQDMEHASGEVDKGSGRTPSERVLRRLRGVGKVLGASFEGYEQRVMDLLMDIEARHQQKKDELLSTRRSSGRKYCRELKGLVSSINYEAKASREAKGKDKVQGGDSMVYQ